MAIHRNQIGEIEVENISTEQFAQDVERGLSSERKFLSSKYFYDKKGDELFVEITKLPEYYLTECEIEILSVKGKELAELISSELDRLNLVELGPGDGNKSSIFIQHFKSDLQLTYIPIDISVNTVEIAAKKISSLFPQFNVLPKAGEYFDALSELQSNEPLAVALFGSNLGNMNPAEGMDFFKRMSNQLKPGDMVIVGLDLIKDKEILIPAYNDSKGVTKEFNLNLLKRINSELGGNFDLEKFSFEAIFDQNVNAIKSYLISTNPCEIHIDSIGRSFHFERGEKIQTEVSHKFDTKKIDSWIGSSQLKVNNILYDSKEYFAEVLMTKS